jgi:hypothetical protein
MKILIVSQYFWPENFRINDLAEALKTRGHEVTVLTGIPNYPAGQFFEGYGLFRRARETWRGPMPEVLGQAGVLFNPEQPADIVRALRELIESPQTRTKLSRMSYERVKQYSWLRCADGTFRFLVGVAQQREKRNL